MAALLAVGLALLRGRIRALLPARFRKGDVLAACAAAALYATAPANYLEGAPAVANLLCGSILTPAAEEVLFRGWLWGELQAALLAVGLALLRGRIRSLLPARFRRGRRPGCMRGGRAVRDRAGQLPGGRARGRKPALREHPDAGCGGGPLPRLALGRAAGGAAERAERLCLERGAVRALAHRVRCPEPCGGGSGRRGRQGRRGAGLRRAARGGPAQDGQRLGRVSRARGLQSV